VVVAELVGADSGVGNMIMMAQRFLKIEGPIPKDESERRKLRQGLSDHHLAFIAEA